MVLQQRVRRVSYWAWVAGFVLAVPLDADAGTINTIFEVPASLDSGFSADGAASANAVLAVDQFDPALGVLNGLIIRTFGGTTGSSNSVFIRNLDDNNARRFIGDIYLDIDVTGPVITPFALNGVEHVAPFSETPPGGLLLDLVALGGGVNEEFVDAATLAAFTGTGTLNYTISFSTHVEQTGGDIGFFDFASDLDVSAGLNVTYFFDEPAPPTPLPEPSSLCLLGVGCVLLVGYGRRVKCEG